MLFDLDASKNFLLLKLSLHLIKMQPQTFSSKLPEQNFHTSTVGNLKQQLMINLGGSPCCHPSNNFTKGFGDDIEDN